MFLAPSALFCSRTFRKLSFFKSCFPIKLETKNKKDTRVFDGRFLLGKLFSYKSHILTLRRTYCIHLQRQTPAASRTPGPVQAFCRTISNREPPPWHRALPEHYLQDLQHCTSAFFFFKRSPLSNSTIFTCEHCGHCARGARGHDVNRDLRVLWQNRHIHSTQRFPINNVPTCDLRRVIFSRLWRNGKHPKPQAKAEQAFCHMHGQLITLAEQCGHLPMPECSNDL